MNFAGSQKLKSLHSHFSFLAKISYLTNIQVVQNYTNWKNIADQS